MVDESPVAVQNDTTQLTAPTWDNPIPVTSPVEEAVSDTPAPDAPAATPPETPDATPTPAELEAQPATEPAAPARESQPEAPKDDYVAEADDPPEIAALTTPAAKRWAKRQFKEAEPARIFLDPQKPIAAFGDDLYKRSESRYWEHVDDLIAAHPDYIAQKLAATKSGDTPAIPPAPVTQPETPSTSTALTEAELANLSDAQIVERFDAVQKAARSEITSLRAELDQKLKQLQAQFDEVNGKFTSAQDQTREQQVIQLESELKTNVMKAVQEVVRESGLEPKADDPSKIANLKRAAIQIFNTQFEPTFDADEDNVKVVERVREFAKRLERANVFREEDNLRVRAVAAAEKVKQLPEMKAIMDEIMAYVEQSKAKPRAENPAPPVPGAAAGVVITPPTSWDEAIAQAKVAEASA